MSEWRWSSTLHPRRKIIRSYRRRRLSYKARWARRGKGKSGGFRVIYFFVAEPGQIHMAAIYAKSRMENLSAADRNVLAKLASQIKKATKGGR
jgi:hypothetical protein